MKNSTFFSSLILSASLLVTLAGCQSQSKIKSQEDYRETLSSDEPRNEPSDSGEASQTTDIGKPNGMPVLVEASEAPVPTLTDHAEQSDSETTTDTESSDGDETPAEAEEFEQAIIAYISEQESFENGYENVGARTIMYGDIDADGDPDVVVQYMLVGAGGGNFYTQQLAAFRNTDSQLEFITEVGVGGKLSQTFRLNRIENGEIYGVAEVCPNSAQGVCENPDISEIVYIISDNEFVEQQ